ncbi:sensor histidine kinase [Aestuariirhabdus litorea]|uniref:C4-dicarboxylate transport sensor protein DctB n=1 Tax=Aestuariirhabdus litorea TaxID=2528527 RepID=A0A3P3VN83_9GAMM|nr:ATP-binding protein [Aestuariirhabdus litorea]RRJ84070.1 sensor histidine kinase [Aestuariirhabdus litorea]RWW97290.1 GHKL domain-containing protein [Endozoicomonadaceae bacterium GTF-13]
MSDLITFIHRRSAIMIGWLVVLFLLLVWISGSLARQVAYDHLQESALAQLQRYENSLGSILSRYQFIPELLGTNPLLKNFLQDKRDEQVSLRLNRYLQKMNEISNTSDIYLLDSQGTTVAASNWNLPTTFIGNNYSFRPYFTQAMEGRGGRYYALGMASGQRGYYFSYPITDAEDIIGVVVIKISLSDIESQWSSIRLADEPELLVTDPDSIAFISTRPQWLYHSLQPLGAVDWQRIGQERRYGDQPLGTLNARPGALPDSLLDSGAKVVTIIENNRTRTYLVNSLAMERAGWQLHLLSPTQPVRNQVLTTVIISAALYIIVVLLLLFLVERVRNVSRLRQAHDLLESRVVSRTADLSETNRRLLDEVEERQRTEQRLRETQDELIQAAKLAVMGQMSAGINHELNQPLAAIRSYAENARKFLERGRELNARANLDEIVQLTAHMSKIVAQFKVFSRKSSGARVSVSVNASLNAAINIIAPQMRQQGVECQVVGDELDLYVMGDMVRLEQVLINLLSNALQAMEGCPSQQLRVSLSSQSGRVIIEVHDSGEGIEETLLERIFEPFFTTKGVSQGLGLGLSISHRIIESMQGTMVAANHPLGGAVFRIELEQSQLQEGIQIA